MIENKSSEDYLEAILVLSKTNGNLKSIDIVNEMGYKKSSISVAMKKLREQEYIKMNENGTITLTDKGLEKAQEVYEKHNYLKNIFIYLGVSEKTAEEDACKIEHVLSDETFECIKSHANKMREMLKRR